MTGTSMRKAIACAAALLALGLAGTACVQEPPVVTTPTLPLIAAGCYDGGGADAEFLGPMNTTNNVYFHVTNNGTCGGRLAGGTDGREFVQAASDEAADALCVGLGRNAAQLPLTSYGYAGLPNVYDCI